MRDNRGKYAKPERTAPLIVRKVATKRGLAVARGNRTRRSNERRRALATYIGAASLKPYLNKDLILEQSAHFSIPGTQFAGRDIPVVTQRPLCAPRCATPLSPTQRP